MKRKRVMLAAVLLVAVVGVVWLTLWRHEGPLWWAVMLERIVHSSHGETTLYSVCRWGEHRGEAYGPQWIRHSDGRTTYFVWESGEVKSGSISTQWNPDGRVYRQLDESPYPVFEERLSPPWWPHPPLIDVSEFEK